MVSNASVNYPTVMYIWTTIVRLSRLIKINKYEGRNKEMKEQRNEGRKVGRKLFLGSLWGVRGDQSG